MRRPGLLADHPDPRQGGVARPLLRGIHDHLQHGAARSDHGVLALGWVDRQAAVLSAHLRGHEVHVSRLHPRHPMHGAQAGRHRARILPARHPPGRTYVCPRLPADRRRRELGRIGRLDPVAGPGPAHPRFEAHRVDGHVELWASPRQPCRGDGHRPRGFQRRAHRLFGRADLGRQARQTRAELGCEGL